jgi:hypothetical protein
MKKFEKHSCDLKNEEECQDELEENGISMDEAEEEMFGED